MPSVTLTKTARNVGTAATTIGGYTTPAVSKSVVVNLTCANLTAAQITVTVKHRDGASVDTHIVKDVPIPAGSTLSVISDGMRLNLEPGHSVNVTSSTAASVDAIMSVVEFT